MGAPDRGVQFLALRNLIQSAMNEADAKAVACPDLRGACALESASVALADALRHIFRAESHINRNPELALAREREGVEA